PTRKPSTVGARPPERSASSTSSNAIAETSTPAPKAMTPATTGAGTRTHQPAAAPSTRELPASSPHPPASAHSGIVTTSTGQPLPRPEGRYSCTPEGVSPGGEPGAGRAAPPRA